MAENSGSPAAPAPDTDPVAIACQPPDAADDGLHDSAAEDAVETREAMVSAAQHGLRLDKMLVAMAGEFSRSWLQQLISRGHVRVNEQPQHSASRKLLAGQRLQLTLAPTAESLAFRSEAMALNIVYEDACLLVVNKPAGLVVHPAPGNWSGTLLNGLLAHHAGAAHLPRAGIVHRLDKDTSGLMVVAKTLPVMTTLVRQIAAREVRRIYLCLVQGRVPWQTVCIEAPVGRDPVSRLRMAVVATGKPARTDVELLAIWDGEAGDGKGSISALRCKLHTGRTHQIRVHLSSRGHVLVADTMYGGRPALGLTRQALHATELAFDHPDDGRTLVFKAELPLDLAKAWAVVQPD